MTKEEFKNLVNQNIKAVDDKSLSLLESLIDKTLEAMLEQSATLVLVTDRNTVNTDIIVFDFDGYS